MTKVSKGDILSRRWQKKKNNFGIEALFCYAFSEQVLLCVLCFVAFFFF